MYLKSGLLRNSHIQLAASSPQSWPWTSSPQTLQKISRNNTFNGSRWNKRFTPLYTLPRYVPCIMLQKEKNITVLRSIRYPEPPPVGPEARAFRSVALCAIIRPFSSSTLFYSRIKPCSIFNVVVQLFVRNMQSDKSQVQLILFCTLKKSNAYSNYD